MRSIGYLLLKEAATKHGLIESTLRSACARGAVASTVVDSYLYVADIDVEEFARGVDDRRKDIVKDMGRKVRNNLRPGLSDEDVDRIADRVVEKIKAVYVP